MLWVPTDGCMHEFTACSCVRMLGWWGSPGRPQVQQQQQLWQHSHSRTFFWASEKRDKNPGEDDTPFTRVRKSGHSTSSLAECSRSDREKDFKLEMVAHPKKKEERPLLNFRLISSSGAQAVTTGQLLSTLEGGGSREGERVNYRQVRLYWLRKNSTLQFLGPWIIKTWE